MKRRILCLIVCILSFFVSASVSAVQYGPATVEIPVKTGWLTVEQKQQTHSYTVRMIPLSDMAPKPEQDEILISEGSTGSFFITLDEPGTFRYKVSEVKTDRPNINSDNAVYEVCIYAEVQPNGDLLTAVSLTRNYLSKPEVIYFDDSVTGKVDPPYPEPGPDPDHTVVTTDGSETVKTGITDGDPDSVDDGDPGAGLENDEDYIDDDEPVQTTAPVNTEETPDVTEEDKSPIVVMVENLLTPKTGNIRIASIAAVMGGALAAVFVFVPRRKKK